MVLLGLMGAGKSTVGRLVAQRLGVPFVDSDAQLEARTGRTAAQLQRDGGRAHLHELEQVELAEQAERTVVFAAAASVADTAEGRAVLERCRTVTLDVPVGELLGRIRSAHRPLPEDDGELAELLAAQHRQRMGRYRRAAELVLDAAGRNPEELAGLIVAHLHAAGGVDHGR